MTQLSITLTIISRSALSIGAGGSAETLADKSIVRDGWGRPIIPGSQVKGKARWAAEQLLRGLGRDIPSPFDEPSLVERESPVRTLFGSPDRRGALRFADIPGFIGPIEQAEMLLASHEKLPSQVRPSVAINRRRGTAEDARLLFQEVAHEKLRFHADPAITGDVPDLPHAALVWAALRLTPRWGGAKSRGLGWAEVTVQVKFNEQPVEEAALMQAFRTLPAEGSAL